MYLFNTYKQYVIAAFLFVLLAPTPSFAIDYQHDFAKKIRELQTWARDRYAVRYQGLELIEGTFWQKSGLYVETALNRKKELADECALTSGECAFAAPASRNIPTISFRKGKNISDFFIMANTYPYLQNHLLFISREEIDGTQNSMEIDPRYLASTLEMHEMLPSHTLTFNHRAGNSMNHFHVHISTQNLPHGEKIKSVSDSLAPVRFGTCSRGVVFAGEREDVQKRLFASLQKLSQRGFLYNLIFLPLTKDQRGKSIHRVMLVGRRDGVDNKNENKNEVGAISGMGLFTLHHDWGCSMSEIEKKVEKICHDTVLSELELMTAIL